MSARSDAQRSAAVANKDGTMSAVEAAWRISSKSDHSGNTCVEAGPLLDGSGRVAVRHSHHPDGPVIIYTCAEWTAFLAGVKTSRFRSRPGR